MANTMRPSSFTAPPRPFVSQRNRTAPPEALTFLSCFPVKNATSLLSGDQNGNIAPSVPESVLWFGESSERMVSNEPRPDGREQGYATC